MTGHAVVARDAVRGAAAVVFAAAVVVPDAVVVARSAGPSRGQVQP
ncbi:hypothetical protein [Streptomyces sp. IBSBF 2390]